MSNIEPITFNFDTVEGISLNQLNQHYKLYLGYVNKTNTIWNILSVEKNYENSNTTYSKMRSLKLGESYALNGVKLHELYFSNMTGESNKPHGDVLALISRDFGSLKNFYTRITDVALSMRGWVVVALDSMDKRLHVFGCDSHDMGSIWNAYPLLVLDVYEHAYMIDFGIDRKKYIEIFFNNINWTVVNQRLYMFNTFNLI
ncbi:superoxide dismutase [Abyssisolibacter fermentans]|uniref:superoxide dismutase n=1 Tax=Abyssisolibacter fermentans TaxID=1766203 RepID=UPI000834CE10|nr:superoxide dismutase [Abyssisolibacter fermentans]